MGRKLEAELRQVVDAIPAAVIVTRVADNALVFANRRAAELFDVPFDELRGELAPGAWIDREQRREVLSQVEVSDTVVAEGLEIRCKEGKTHLLRLVVGRAQCEGEQVRVWSLFEAQGAQPASDRDTTLRSLVTMSSGPLLVERKHDGRIMLTNRDAATLFGRLENQLVGRNMAELFADEGARKRAYDGLAAEGQLEGLEAELESSVGEGVTAVLRARSGRYAGDDVFLWAIAPVAGEGAESAKHQAAIRDPVTGLYNRVYFSRVAHHEVERARRYGRTLCIAVLEIDWPGRSVTDEILQAIADICLECVREVDVVARHERSELVALLPETPRSGAEKVVERMRKAVEGAGRAGDLDGLNLSVGLSELLPEDDGLVDVMQRAEAALVHARDAGRNCVRVIS